MMAQLRSALHSMASLRSAQLRLALHKFAWIMRACCRLTLHRSVSLRSAPHRLARSPPSPFSHFLCDSIISCSSPFVIVLFPPVSFFHFARRSCTVYILSSCSLVTLQRCCISGNRERFVKILFGISHIVCTSFFFYFSIIIQYSFCVVKWVD